jgi:hypothetical protein
MAGTLLGVVDKHGNAPSYTSDYLTHRSMCEGCSLVMLLVVAISHYQFSSKIRQKLMRMRRCRPFTPCPRPEMRLKLRFSSLAQPHDTWGFWIGLFPNMSYNQYAPSNRFVYTLQASSHGASMSTIELCSCSRQFSVVVSGVISTPCHRLLPTRQQFPKSYKAVESAELCFALPTYQYVVYDIHYSQSIPRLFKRPIHPPWSQTTRTLMEPYPLRTTFPRLSLSL